MKKLADFLGGLLPKPVHVTRVEDALESQRVATTALNRQSERMERTARLLRRIAAEDEDALRRLTGTTRTDPPIDN